MFGKHFLIKFFLGVLVLGCLLGVHHISLAQLQEADISLSITPSFPKPGQDVNVRAFSFNMNLDKAFISWMVNGQERSNGVGKTNFSFTLDGLSNRTQITATITLTNGTTITKSTFVSSSEIDLLWEAVESHTPPFYRGKALATREGSFKVVALPSINSSRGKIKPANLSYSWKKDGDPQVQASGFGKNSFSFKNSYIDNNNEIEVTVSDIENNTKTQSKIFITYRPKPEVLFYKKDPLLGVLYNNALSSGYTLGKEPETLVAIPYYVAPKNLNSNRLTFNWETGGRSIRPSGRKNEITIASPGEPGGTDITLKVTSLDTLFQEITQKIDVGF